MEEENFLSPVSSSSGSGYSYPLLIQACMAAVASWIFIYRWMQRNKKGPKTWPLLGSLIEALMSYDTIHDWLVDYLSVSESKNLVVPIPFITFTFTADPANAEHILRTNFANYPKGEVFRSIMEELLGDGIFNADGELWRTQRKTASFEFSAQNLRDFSTVVFRDYSLKLCSILSQASKQKKQVDMQELFMRMTLDSICEVGFGVEIASLDPNLPENRFAQAFDAANMIVAYRFVDPIWKIKRFLKLGSEALLVQSNQVLDDFTYAVIRRRKAEIEEAQEHKSNKANSDLLSRFIELGNDPNSKFSDKSLRDIILNFVIAGRDTTAVTLSWAFYMITTHEDVAEKLYRELISFEQQWAKKEQITMLEPLPEDDESFRLRAAQFANLLTYESLGKLYYLHAVITETLRLYPAVPMDLKGVLEDDVWPDGTKVKAGDFVAYVPYSMGRMEYNWGPDAASFKPERWLKDGFFQNGSPFKFTAFQAGPRICLGKDSAYLQMKMSLAILCRFFKFSLVPGHPVKYKTMIILTMAHGVKVAAELRSRAHS